MKRAAAVLIVFIFVANSQIFAMLTNTVGKHSEPNDFAGNIHDFSCEKTITLCLKARSEGNMQEAQAYEDMICEQIIEDSNRQQTLYILTYALYSGLYQIPEKGLEIINSEAFDSREKLDLYMLVARAHYSKYWQYLYSHNIGMNWPTKEEWEDLNAISKECTSAYEMALNEAKSSYERAQISAEWWRLNSHNYFIADSQALRNTYPYDMSQYNETRLKRQIEILEDEINKCFMSESRKVSATPQLQKRVCKSIIDNYAELGKLDIPDHVFEEFIDGLALFLDKGHPFMMYEDQYANAFDDTMHFYIWHALIKPRPSSAERLVLNRNIDEICRLIQVEVDRQFSNEFYQPIGEKVAQDLRDFYNLTSANRLFPYFKSMPLHQEYNQISKVKKSITDSAETFKARVKETMESYPSASSSEKKVLMDSYYKAEYATFNDLITSIWKDLCFYSGPMYSYGLPKYEIISIVGNYNRFGFYHYVVLEKRKYGTYPLSKKVVYRNK